MAKKQIKETIHAKGIDIAIYTTDFENEYISLTDIARYRSSDPRITIHTWLRGRDIVEFLGLWEAFYVAISIRLKKMQVQMHLCSQSKNGTMT